MMNLAGREPKGNSLESMDLGFLLQALSLERVATGARRAAGGCPAGARRHRSRDRPADARRDGRGPVARVADAPDYAVPALDKALDILELLADRADGADPDRDRGGDRSQRQPDLPGADDARGARLDRCATAQSGLYSFSMAAFDLAHRHPPLRGLLDRRDAADARAAPSAVRQSCNLSVLDAGAVRVIAQVESPADFGYRVRVGALFPLAERDRHRAGRRREPECGRRCSTTDPVPSRADRDRRLAAPRRSAQPGIADRRHRCGRRGCARAALTVPYVATSFSAIDASSERARERGAIRATRGPADRRASGSGAVPSDRAADSWRP